MSHKRIMCAYFIMARPFLWTQAMSDAWHSNLPDIPKAFEALESACLNDPNVESRVPDEVIKLEEQTKQDGGG